MSIDFSTLQGLTIQEGAVTQVADASGRVLWAAPSGGKVILEVEKFTSDTYAGETTYTGEEFILLDIYPKTNGTVTVTYGGLTKTITDTSGAEEPNAQQVFFGTFNGVSDEVETPASGTLTIEGDYYAFACGTYQLDSKDLVGLCCACVTKVINFGIVKYIPANAFGSLNEDSYTCVKLTSINIPDSVTLIGDDAFFGCTGLTNIIVSINNNHYSSIGGILFNKDKTLLHSYPSAVGLCIIPNSVTSIGNHAFHGASLTSINIPDSVTSIGNYAFWKCDKLTSINIPDSVTSIGQQALSYCTSLTSINIPDSVTSISRSAFSGSTGLTSVTFDNTSGWYVTQKKGGDISTGTAVDLSDPANNATLINNTYVSYYWYRA